MKKKSFLLLALTLLCALFTATACFDSDSEHTHTFGEWVIVTQPTCQAEGLRRQTCSCGEVREEPLPRTEHSYKYGICTDCGTVDSTSDYLTLRTLFTQKYKKNFMAIWHDMTLSSVEDFDDYAIVVSFSPTKLQEIEETYQVKLTALRSLQLFNYNLALEFSSAEERDALLETSGYRLYQKIGSNLAVNKAFFIDSYQRQNYGFFSEDGSVLLRATPPADFTIPASVTAIGDHAFSGCSNLVSVNIGNSVTYIGDFAFYICRNLDSVIIGNSVTYIGDSAFAEGSSLASITVADDNPSYQSIDGNLYSKDGSVLIQYAVAKGSESFTIPDSVIIIRDRAFCGCLSLTSINIPDSVSFIGERTFFGCSNLTSVSIPDSVTSIGDSAFYYCRNLTSITIPKSLTSIGDHAFSYCHNLTSITIPESLTSIGDHAFSGCRGLSSIFIPDSVAYIGTGAFTNCSSLTAVSIPDSVTFIGDFAFSSCSNLTTITVSDSNSSYQSIDGNLYSKDGSFLMQYASGKTSESFTIPDSVTSIGRFAFSYCFNLTSITIPDAVTSIGNYSFYHCSSLASIAIPDSVTFIGEHAFYYCFSLASITIPDSVTSIDSGAFSGCSNLTIYAEAETQPTGWKIDWNSDSRPVVWGYCGALENATETKNNGGNTVVTQ